MKNKSLLTQIKNVSLIGATVIGCWLTNTTKLLALPQEVIIQKLRPIPVFTIADAQGAPLIASNEENAKVAGVFISKQDANSFVDRLKKDNPTLGNQVQVIPVSLGEIFELAEANAKEKEPVIFAYVPTQAQVEQAKKLNNQYQSGVPLFVAKAGDDQGYLTIKQNDQEVIPFFFDQQQVQQLVDNFKKAQPDLAGSVKIDVVILEGVLEALKEGNDEMLTKIVLWPSKESIDFLRANAPNQN
ncbi:Tic22 family protein [Geminocystis sp. CENA526]|uniref:Tic22 family protein n=1 Tax=Geminocystis sp. CENA526 TaxID=1355871 RepID=UPI003D6F3450